jgi:hypothetical protein
MIIGIESNVKLLGCFLGGAMGSNLIDGLTALLYTTPTLKEKLTRLKG